MAKAIIDNIIIFFMLKSCCSFRYISRLLEGHRHTERPCTHERIAWARSTSMRSREVGIAKTGTLGIYSLAVFEERRDGEEILGLHIHPQVAHTQRMAYFLVEAIVDLKVFQAYIGQILEVAIVDSSAFVVTNKLFNSVRKFWFLL